MPLRDRIHTLIKKTERFTRTDTLYLLRGGSWTVFAQIANTILTFALLIGFANLLPKETYGNFRYLLSIAGLLGIFTLGEMNQAVVRATALGDEGALRASVRYQLMWHLAMMIALWVFAGYYFVHHNTLFALSFFIMGIFLPAAAAYNTYSAYLSGKKLFGINAISSIITTLIYVLGMFGVMFLSHNIAWIMVAYSLAVFIPPLGFYLYIVYRFKPPAHTTSDVVTYGRTLTFISFLNPIVSQMDKIVLNHFWGPIQLASYTLATAIPEKLAPLLKDWIDIVFPKLSTKKIADIGKNFYLRIFQGMLVGALAGAAYIILAPTFFALLLPKYLDTIGYSQILAVGLIFALPNRYVSLILASQKMTRIIFYNITIQSLVNLAIDVVFGIFGGLAGLVIAQVLWSFVSCAINLVMWEIAKRHVLPSMDTQNLSSTAP